MSERSAYQKWLDLPLAERTSDAGRKKLNDWIAAAKAKGKDMFGNTIGIAPIPLRALRARRP